jgi:hypothetical protein
MMHDPVTAIACMGSVPEETSARQSQGAGTDAADHPTAFGNGVEQGRDIGVALRRPVVGTDDSKSVEIGII